jgi:hypothetical protein
MHTQITIAAAPLANNIFCNNISFSFFDLFKPSDESIFSVIGLGEVFSVECGGLSEGIGFVEGCECVGVSVVVVVVVVVVVNGSK